MLKDSGAAMQTSGARTRGPNPTAARPKAIATRTHYSIAHTLGQLFLLTAAARLLKSILPKSLKAIPGDFPLKSILGTLLSLFLKVKPTGFPHRLEMGVRETEVIMLIMLRFLA